MITLIDHYGKKGAMQPKFGSEDIVKSLASTIE